MTSFDNCLQNAPSLKIPDKFVVVGPAGRTHTLCWQGLGEVRGSPSGRTKSKGGFRVGGNDYCADSKSLFGKSGPIVRSKQRRVPRRGNIRGVGCALSDVGSVIVLLCPLYNKARTTSP